MDGASRFTQRDAIASILITGINIIAGFLIGVLQHGMDLRRALETYTVLTIGDGLVTVIPALMISISGGLIVTRASSDNALGAEFQQAGLRQPAAADAGERRPGGAGAFPGLPTIPFLLMGGGRGHRRPGGCGRKRLTRRRPPRSEARAPAARRKPRMRCCSVEPLAVEVGLGLVKLVEGGQNSPLLRRIAGIRRQLASELGYLLPPVRVTDNLALRPREYVISLKGVEIARFELPQGCELAIPAGKSDAAARGQADARAGLRHARAVGSARSRRSAPAAADYTVVDPVSVLGTHLAEMIRRHAHELFSRQDAKKLLDRVAEENPKVVEDLVPKLLPLATVQRVLQNLLRERVSIRDAVIDSGSAGRSRGDRPAIRCC